MIRSLFLPAAAVIVSACVTPLAQTQPTETSTMVDQEPLTIERLFASPGLSGPTPTGVKYSPDGKRVTFLKAREDDTARFDLWQFDVATGAQSLLVDSKLLEPEEVELSEEEKALRERKRIAGRKGIVSYDWGTADTILVPLGGDLHLVTLGPSNAESDVRLVLKPAADELGITYADVASSIRKAYFGEEVQRLPRDGEAPDIRASNGRTMDLDSAFVKTASGEEVSLADVARMEFVSNPSTLSSRQLTETDAFEYDAKVSPGGSYVSFIRDGAVFAIDLASGEERRLTPEAEPDKAIAYGVAEFVAQEEMSRYTGYWWSPDDRYLAYTRVDESTVDIIPRFDIAAEDVTVINQRYPRAGRPNAIVDLFVRDMKTGEVTEIGWRWDDEGATDTYLARVSWSSNDALEIQAIDRKQKNIYYRGAPRLLNWRTEGLASESQPNFVNLASPRRWHAESQTLIYSSERNGFRHIYARVGLPDAYAVTSGEWAIEEIELVNFESREVFFTGFKDTPLERHLYSAPIEGGQPRRLTELGKSWSVTMAPDGKSFVGTSSSPTQPPQTGLYRITQPLSDAELEQMDAKQLPDSDCIDLTPMAKQVTKSCPDPIQLITWIEENRLDETHPYAPYLEDHTVPEYGTLTAEDGQTLYYSIQLPPDFDASQTYPALVEIYGGPHVQTVNRNWERLSDQFYSRQGYVVFRIDNRGMANRGKRFEDVIYRQMGIPEVQDVLVGVDWLKSQPFIDGDRVGIQGWSYGGYMTLMTILQAPEGTFAAAVAGAPVTDWGLYDTFYTERYMDTPQDNPEGYERSSVFYHLDQREAPLPQLMLVHGMADDNVSFDNTTRLMAELQQRGVLFELMTYPGQRHGIRGQALSTHLMTTRMNFLDRHLK